MGRKILGVLAGVATAMVLVWFIEMIGHTVYPPPEGLDYTDSAAMSAYLQTMPTGAFWFVLAGWTIACFVGAWVASLIGKAANLVWIIGAVLIVMTSINLILIAHPLWFAVTGIVLLIVSTLAAWSVVRGKFGAMTA